MVVPELPGDSVAGELAGENLGDDPLDRPDMAMASPPPMFGNFGGTGVHVWGSGSGGSYDACFDPGGSGRRAKVADNNVALPQDRIYFAFNHFQNAWQADYPGGDVHVLGSTTRYTVAGERTFFDKLWSIELRMPFGGNTIPPSVEAPPLSLDSAELGNLAVILKRVIYRSETMSSVLGMAVDIPTGGDAQVYGYYLRNDAVHLSPYWGFVSTPNTDVFFHGFVQIDVPTNGNEIGDYYYDFPQWTSLGYMTEPVLLHVDIGAGRWLYRNRAAQAITGLAALIELHYTSAIAAGNTVRPGSWAGFTSSGNHAQLVHLTFGAHLELFNRTDLRIAGVVPLQRGSRDFDGEVAASVIRRF